MNPKYRWNEFSAEPYPDTSPEDDYWDIIPVDDTEVVPPTAVHLTWADKLTATVKRWREQRYSSLRHR